MFLIEFTYVNVLIEKPGHITLYVGCLSVNEIVHQEMISSEINKGISGI